MLTNPYYLILQAKWGVLMPLMGKPLSLWHIFSFLYVVQAKGLDICGPPSSITLQQRELVKVGVGQFLKYSLPDT